MLIKRENLFLIDRALEVALNLTDSSAKFKIRALKNKRLISGEIEDVKSIAAPSQEYISLEEGRINLCKEYSEKDEDENPIIEDILDNEGNVVNKQYKIDEEKKEEFEKLLEKLREDNKETIKNHENKDTEVKNMLEEEIEIPFVKIQEDIIPDSLDSESLDALFDLIL